MLNDGTSSSHRSQIRGDASMVALEEIPDGGGGDFTSGNRGLVTGLFGILVHD